MYIFCVFLFVSFRYSKKELRDYSYTRTGIRRKISLDLLPSIEKVPSVNVRHDARGAFISTTLGVDR